MNREDLLEVPHYNALDVASTLRNEWGIRIVPFGVRLPYVKMQHIMATYRLNDDYIKGWVHHKKNGPGVFLEHHQFMHMMTPADPSAHGSFVVGRFTGAGWSRRGSTHSVRHFEVVAISVPFGYTIIIPGGMLHCDWYFKGLLTTTLAADDNAEVAFIRGRDNKRVAYVFTEAPSR